MYGQADCGFSAGKFIKVNITAVACKKWSCCGLAINMEKIILPKKAEKMCVFVVRGFLL